MPILAYDLGGTKIAAGVVSKQGKVLEERREPARFNQGKDAVIRQLSDLGKFFLKKYPEIKNVGMASAGPLDPKKGILLDPTNFAGPDGAWGNVPIAKILSKNLKRPVKLENDAAAAILAEQWVGAAKKTQNAMILTLGTGLGTGIIIQGQLVRAGRNLHPEAGHIIIHHGDATAPCGCGNLGCAEAYLSGRSFTRRARTRFANPNLVAKDIVELARNQDPRALAAFDEYAYLMAIAIHNYAVIYAPEKIIFAGSFAVSGDLFIPQTERNLENLLKRRTTPINLIPRLKVSDLKNQSGIIGAAYIALRK